MNATGMPLVENLYGAVLYRMRCIGEGRHGEPRLSPRLERQDFEEQFALAVSADGTPDDEARLALCKRWLKTYQCIDNTERKASNHGKSEADRQRSGRMDIP